MILSNRTIIGMIKFNDQLEINSLEWISWLLKLLTNVIEKIAKERSTNKQS